MKTALETAQEIIDSTVDIRPEYKGKQVDRLEISPPTEALTVQVYFKDGTHTVLAGLWAHEIVKHLPQAPML